jgi:uncharacterized damage-inducible protein DinB
MLLSSQIAKHVKEVFFGDNWTAVNLKDTLKDVTWQQATRKVHSCNTITALVYHINYYVSAVLKVLQGGSLDAHDKYSFDHPTIQSQDDWEALVNKTFTDAEQFTDLAEKIAENKFGETFADEKYGTYYRNLHGIIEHTHYHMGQIVILKKVIQSEEQES